VSSAALMLEHLGEVDAASRITRAVQEFSGDVSLGTASITQEIVGRL
jgi:isocitrate/isopropylmalate dehydrogenase